MSLGDKGLVIQMLPHQSERAQILRQIATKRGQPPKVEPKTNTFLRQKPPSDRNSSYMYCFLHKGDTLHFMKLQSSSISPDTHRCSSETVITSLIQTLDMHDNWADYSPPTRSLKSVKLRTGPRTVYLQTLYFCFTLRMGGS